MKRVEDINLDWLHARVREQDGHWIWAGYCGNDGRVPQVRIGSAVLSVNRVIWELTHERAVPPKMRVGPRCLIPGCVHPDCLVARKPSALLRGKSKPLQHRINIAMARRANSEFSEEEIQAIRADDRLLKEVAADYGASPSYIWRVRTDLTRKDYANPFAGLLACRGGA